MITNLFKLLDRGRRSPIVGCRRFLGVLTGAVAMMAGSPVDAAGISNVRVSQRPDTGLVDIRYDLVTSHNQGMAVTVAISTDGGLSYDLTPIRVTGDVGVGVLPGADKWIVWDAAGDWPDASSTNVFFQLTPGDAPPGMAPIPAGSFTMGNSMDPNEGHSQELPLHIVHVSAFHMDKHEVTGELWQEVRTWANANGYDLGALGAAKAPDHPVHSVNWYEAVKWSNARSEKEGLVPAYYTEAAHTTVYRTGHVEMRNEWVKWDAGYRLPTEAEWEQAARGGVEGRRFPWSDTDTIQHSRANYDSRSYSYDTSLTREYHPTFATGGGPYTSPVGYFAPNGYGLCDMAGNVWEWCWDWYGDFYYSASPSTDPRGPEAGSERVVRGSGWASRAFFCRVAARSSRGPTDRYSLYGFRSVLPRADAGESSVAVFGPVAIDTRRPDLSVMSLETPAEAFAGSTQTVAWILFNQGAKPVASAWVDRVYLSADAVLGEDRLVGELPGIGPLAPQDSLRQALDCVVPDDLEPDRDYWWIVVTDAGDDLDEADETNNVRMSAQPTRVLATPVPNRLTVAWEAGAFAVHLPTVPGKLYSLEYKNRIEDPLWSSVVEVSGDGTDKALLDPAPPQMSRFYRVRMH